MTNTTWTNIESDATPSPGEPAPWLNKDNDDEESPVTNTNTTGEGTTTPTNPDDKSSSNPQSKKRCGIVVRVAVSALFFALFVYSASVQNNDVDSWQWLLFYALHATIPAMYILYTSCCFPEKLVFGVAGLMIIWSIVFIIIASINVSNANSNASSKDVPGISSEDDNIFELVGSLLTLISAIYHPMMVRYFGAKAPTDNAAPAMS